MPKSPLTPRALEIRALLRRHERGESLESLAREAGLKLATLTWWRSRLRRGPRLEPQNFVEVQVARAPTSSAPLVVAIGELRHEIPRDFDEEQVVQAIRVLRRC